LERSDILLSSTYIIKAIWPATSKLLKVVAASKEEALDKAARRNDVKRKGCLKLVLQSER
jgi:hypothetical protein